MKTFVPVRLATLPAGSGRGAFLSRLIRDPATAVPSELTERRIFAPSFAEGRLAFVADADTLETILVKRPDDFPKGYPDERIFRPALGSGLLLAEGEDWRWKRRLTAPVFAPAVLRRFIPEMVAPFEALADEWSAGPGPRPVDVSDAMKTATLAVIDALLFAGRREIDPERIKRQLDDYLDPVPWVVAYAVLRMPHGMPFPGRRKMLRAKTGSRGIIGDFVRRRREDPGGVDDFCNRLLAATDPESGRRLSDEDMVDMLLTLVSAGHETSANALTWAIHCLTEMPVTAERLAAEVEAVAGSGPIDQAVVSRLETVRAFLLETMRLFPPAPAMSRRTRRAESFGAVTVEEGGAVMIPVYSVHRHPDYWEKPDVFDLDRFTGGREAKLRRTVYLPFGAGPKICVGSSLALLEMTAGLAAMLRRVRFRPMAGAAPKPRHRVTLRPREPLRALALPRDGSGSVRAA